MNPEIIPSTQQIKTAETMRVEGLMGFGTQADILAGNQFAVAEMKPATAFTPLDSFANLPLTKQQELLMAARLHAVAETSLSSMSRTEEESRAHLEEARNTLISFGRNPAIMERASVISKDTEGKPYEFAAELLGDQGSYLRTLAERTGDKERYLPSASELYVEMGNLAQESTAKTLAYFESTRLSHRLGPTKRRFYQLKKSWQAAVVASAEIGRWERVATVDARYAIEAGKTGHVIEAVKAWRSFRRAVVENPNTRSILKRQIGRELHVRQFPNPGRSERYASLALPPLEEFLQLQLEQWVHNVTPEFIQAGEKKVHILNSMGDNLGIIAGGIAERANQEKISFQEAALQEGWGLEDFARNILVRPLPPQVYVFEAEDRPVPPSAKVADEINWWAVLSREQKRALGTVIGIDLTKADQQGVENLPFDTIIDQAQKPLILSDGTNTGLYPVLLAGGAITVFQEE